VIVFDLRCAGGHVFEAWFASGAAFEEQRARGLLMCPTCGDADVGKAVMAPNVAAKGNRAAAGAPPPQVRAMLAAVAAAQAEALKTSRWVGGAFAETARAMHEGTAPEAPIHGRATPDEARALAEDGVPVLPLLVPVVPPEAAN
jgi:hypothetical protein